MSTKLMGGFWRYMLSIPAFLWEKQISKEKKKKRIELGFMTEEHRRVHHWVVRELPRVGEPISAEYVAEKLSMPCDRVQSIFNDLEKHMTFICRNSEGLVVWAYPVTVEKTPHRVTFSTGEQIYAAWAVDAFATPFVQGRLRGEPLTVEIRSECAHCSQPMHIQIDSDLNYHIKEEGCEPVVFVPDVNFSKLEDKCIIHAFWEESVFFWSEEHAREYRKKEHRIRGAYFTAEQTVFVTRAMQSVLFGFEQLNRGTD